MMPSNIDSVRSYQRSHTTSRPPRAARWDRAEYQQLWLRMESRAWRTLTVVPAEHWMSTYDVASLIMAVGVHHGESIGIFDFRDVGMNRVLAVIEAACQQMRREERIIFAARSIKENLATIPLARATDCVVLCASIGSTPIRLAEEAIAQIGKERFLGSILVRQPDARAPEPSLALWHERLEA